MTDKQIIIHGVDIRLFRTPVEVMHYLQQGDLYVVTKELLEQLKRKEQECERLTSKCSQLDQLKEQLEAYKMEAEEGKEINAELEVDLQNARDSLDALDLMRVGEYNALVDDYKELEKRHNDSFEQFKQLKTENENLKESLKMVSSTLNWALKSEVGLYKRQIDNSVPDDWEYEEVLVLVEQYIEKLKSENEILEKVNKNNQEKIKKLNEQLEEMFIAKQYGDEALFFVFTDCKQALKNIVDGKIGKCCCPEEYAMKVISEVEDVGF